MPFRRLPWVISWLALRHRERPRSTRSSTAGGCPPVNLCSPGTLRCYNPPRCLQSSATPRYRRRNPRVPRSVEPIRAISRRACSTSARTGDDGYVARDYQLAQASSPSKLPGSLASGWPALGLAATPSSQVIELGRPVETSIAAGTRRTYQVSVPAAESLTIAAGQCRKGEPGKPGRGAAALRLFDVAGNAVSAREANCGTGGTDRLVGRYVLPGAGRADGRTRRVFQSSGQRISTRLSTRRLIRSQPFATNLITGTSPRSQDSGAAASEYTELRERRRRGGRGRSAAGASTGQPQGENRRRRPTDVDPPGGRRDPGS